MTHYYYDSKANKFYGPLDRMPPAPIGYDLKPEHEFDDYLKSITSHPHSFTGHSRVVPEGEIEWRYEVDDKSDPFGQRWVEVTKHTYDNFHDTLPKRKVAVPIEAKEVSPTTMRRKFERLIGERERPDGSKVSMPINESPGYTSTSGEEAKPEFDGNWDGNAVDDLIKENEKLRELLTAQPDKPRHIGFDDLVSAIEIAISYRDFGVLSEILKHIKSQSAPSPSPQTGEKELDDKLIELGYNPEQLGKRGETLARLLIENADLKRKLEQEQKNHNFTRFAWDETCKERDALKAAHQSQMGDKPRKVCYCGSLRVAKEAFKKAEYDSVINGDIALLPCCMFVDIQREYGAESDYKQKADDLHKRKIDMCDEVFVLNVGGYIGESTRSEIEYATKIGKPIKYLEP